MLARQRAHAHRFINDGDDDMDDLRPRLLLVEDDPVSRAYLAEALEEVPAEVEAAADIAEACRLARLGSHVLWLVDNHLPDGSGLDCLRALRAISTTPIAVAITAEAHRDRFDALCAGGFSEVLQKPIGVATLQANLRRILAGTSGPSAKVDHGKLPAWDEAQALAAVGGNRATLAALRQLFVAELPAQQGRIRDAHGRGDAEAIRAELHKLKASCAFVGASRLLQAVQALSLSPLDGDRMQRFDEAAADCLPEH
jgi:DNA-binding response OmpR family regulator